MRLRLLPTDACIPRHGRIGPYLPSWLRPARRGTPWTARHVSAVAPVYRQTAVARHGRGGRDAITDDRRGELGVTTTAAAAGSRRRHLEAANCEHVTRARHVLRALLRECTYLPDSRARAWMRQHVLQRFRTYAFKAWKHRDDREFDQRIERKLREARQAARQLRRANAGERKALLKVLLMAYGRLGKRRHELLTPLLPVAAASGARPAGCDAADAERVAGVDSPADDETHQAGDVHASIWQRQGHLPSAHEVNQGHWTPYAPELTPQLRALLQSHIQHPPPRLTRSMLRRLQPRIEEQNAWRRPMPRSRVRNQTQKWYADLLERVLPPLPVGEWQLLHDLAQGKVTQQFPVRRAAAAPQHPPSALELVVKYGKPDAPRAFGHYSRDAHHITPRYMRRLWAQVFSQCPLMEWHAETQRWTVVWGDQALYGIKSAPGA